MTRPAFDIARWRPAPLLSRRSNRDGGLMAAMVLLTALSCLAAISAFAANRAARGWIGELSGAATVIVRANGADTPDQAAARAAEALAGYPGVVEARALPASDVEALLSPWMGKAADLADLPMPRLVDLRLDQHSPPQTSSLQTMLNTIGLDATVDDHRSWTRAIERSAELARWSAVAVCALVAACAAAMIAFATRAAIEARHEMVEVLHLTGGRDDHIADIFAGRAASAAFEAATLGAAVAAGIGVIVRLVGGQDGLVPFMPVAWIDLISVLAAPPVVAAIAALAGRNAARRLLASMP